VAPKVRTGGSATTGQAAPPPPDRRLRRLVIFNQLWTTQTEKLPQERLDNNWLWDNIGGNFEEYEIQSDFGEYRVMRRELPTEYSITAIVTGYHKNGKWIWRNYFRPI